MNVEEDRAARVIAMCSFCGSFDDGVWASNAEAIPIAFNEETVNVFACDDCHALLIAIDVGNEGISRGALQFLREEVLLDAARVEADWQRAPITDIAARVVERLKTLDARVSARARRLKFTVIDGGAL